MHLSGGRISAYSPHVSPLHVIHHQIKQLGNKLSNHIIPVRVEWSKYLIWLVREQKTISINCVNNGKLGKYDIYLSSRTYTTEFEDLVLIGLLCWLLQFSILSPRIGKFYLFCNLPTSWWKVYAIRGVVGLPWFQGTFAVLACFLSQW